MRSAKSAAGGGEWPAGPNSRKSLSSAWANQIAASQQRRLSLETLSTSLSRPSPRPALHAGLSFGRAPRRRNCTAASPDAAVPLAALARGPPRAAHDGQILLLALSARLAAKPRPVDGPGSTRQAVAVPPRARIRWTTAACPASGSASAGSHASCANGPAAARQRELHEIRSPMASAKVVSRRSVSAQLSLLCFFYVHAFVPVQHVSLFDLFLPAPPHAACLFVNHSPVFLRVCRRDSRLSLSLFLSIPLPL